MSVVTLEFDKVPYERAEGQNSQLSAPFLELISGAVRNSGPTRSMTFELRSTNWVSAAELVVLACTIRRVAMEGTAVSVLLPQKKTSTFLWTLLSYRFPQLLGFPTKTESWQHNIAFQGHRFIGSESATLNVKRNVIPLTWIDAGTFGVDECDSLYKVEPEFEPRYTQFLNDVLHRNGFVSPDASDTFVRGILRELAWNAVLHSRNGKPGSYAAFAGQILAGGSRLEFALSDVGCGIVDTLKGAYSTARQARRVVDYQKRYRCSEGGAVTRFAFEANSTSRTEFPSDYDAFSDRGLSLVANIARETGSVSLASARSIVSTGIGDPDGFSVHENGVFLPGTTLFGALVAQSDEATTPGEQSLHTLELNSTRWCSMAALLERMEPTRARALFLRLTERSSEEGSAVVVDFGFAEPSIRFVENTIAATVVKSKGGPVIAVNLRSSRVSVSQIARVLSEMSFDGDAQLQVVDEFRLLSEVELKKSDYESAAQRALKKRWKKSTLTIESAQELHFEVNTAYFKTSFATKRPMPGCYRGKVHLLNGNVTSRYFSLVAHLELSKDNDARRWGQATKSLLTNALSGSETDAVKLVGFSASTRRILNAIRAKELGFSEVYCLLSYDAPSRSELAGAIERGDELVLFTDVVSTGSLLTEIVTLARRIGATVLAIVALVDARADQSRTWRTTFQPDAGGISMLLASTMQRTTDEEVKEESASFWVDPVSAVPLRSPPVSTVNIEKALKTVEILNETSAIAVGHFVSGLRHSSVELDMKLLLSERQKLLEATERELTVVRNEQEWNEPTFRPLVALVPSGVHRIDKLDASGDELTERPTSAIYADIVCELLAERPRIVPVARSFEPGGQARCASIDHVATSADISDTLIIDDGISSGSTLRSLLQQAVRAGARRILVFALLARMSFEEWEQWELTRQITDPLSGNKALVALVSPLHLPLPFSTQSECSQCVTLATLENRGASTDFLRQGRLGIQSDLGASRSLAVASESPLYTSTWLTVHVLSEVASRSVKGFETLKGTLRELATTSAAAASRAAVVRLFLVEWRLLGRSRLRQVIRRVVHDIASVQLSDATVGETEFIDALSLIRSSFPEDYLHAVRKHASVIVNSELILDRCLFHLDTIGLLGLEEERQETLDALGESLSSVSDSHSTRVVRQKAAIRQLGVDLAAFAESSDPVVVVRGLQRSLLGSSIKHDVIPTLNEVTKVAPHRLKELQANGYFSPLADQVDEVVIPVLERELYPNLYGARGILGAALRQSQLGGLVERSYFDPEILSAEEAPTLVSDVRHVRDACRNISSGLVVGQMLRIAVDAANRALTHTLMPESKLRSVLSLLTQVDVKGVLAIIHDSLRGFLPDATIELRDEIAGFGPTSVDCWPVFVPRGLIIQFVALVKSNIQKHVLDQGMSDSEVMLLVYAEFSESGSRQVVSFNVSNSGVLPFRSSAEPKFRSRRLNEDLKIFDGGFVPVSPAEEPFLVTAKLRLRAVKERLA